MEFILSLAGAFFGALAAFLLEAWRRKQEELAKRLEAILAAQTTLISQANSMFSIHQQLREAEGKKPFDNLKYSVLRFSQRTLDFRELTFIASSPLPHVLLDLEVAQDQFLFAVDLLERRNIALERFLNDQGTKIEETEPATGQVRAIGDPRLLRELKQFSAAIITAFPRAFETNRRARDRLLEFGHRVLPKRLRKSLLFVRQEIESLQKSAPGSKGGGGEVAPQTQDGELEK